MADRDNLQEGGCRCGQVRFRIDGGPLITMACHCTGCQRMTASGSFAVEHGIMVW